MSTRADLVCTSLKEDLRRIVSALPGACVNDLRPLSGGRSNEVWRSGQIVVKIYRASSATPLFPNDLGQEAAALEALGPLGLAPHAVARGADWLAWRHVAGTAWRGEDGLASLLQRLSRVPAFSGLKTRPMGAWEIATHARSFAPNGMPSMPELLDVPLPTPSLLHGDLVPGNIICTGEGLCLIDWQCPGWGDPVDDLALFLSAAMQWLYRGRSLTPNERLTLLAQVPEALRYRYERLAPVLHWRIAAHCAFRAARGDADYDIATRLELQFLQNS